MKSRLIAIAGGSGSGKTWLARELQQRLGTRARPLCLDHFYRDRSHLTLRERQHLNFDHPRALDWDCFLDVITRLRRGWSAQVPVYDFTISSRSGPDRRMPPSPLVMVDGLWPFHWDAMRPMYALTVYVDSTAQERLGRLLTRDPVERARPRRAVERHFWGHVEPMHQRFVAPQRDAADLVVHAPVSHRVLERLVRRMNALIDAPTPEVA